MKRVCSIITMLTIIALFNIGGCGGSDDEATGFKPVIDRIVFFQNSDKTNQVQSYTQGSEGNVELTISDYDLNAETVELQINQCTDASCTQYTAFYGPEIYSFSQEDTIFNYTVPHLSELIKVLPAIHYYQFVFEVMDRKGQSSVSNRIIEINTGSHPEIYAFYFYKERYPGERLDTWSSYYDFVAEFKARDLDLNAKYIYINRTCLETKDANQTKPSFNQLGPIELDSDDTNTIDMTINTNSYVNQKTSEINLIQKLLSTEGLYQITIILEDALGNTAELSRNITIKQ